MNERTRGHLMVLAAVFVALAVPAAGASTAGSHAAGGPLAVVNNTTLDGVTNDTTDGNLTNDTTDTVNDTVNDTTDTVNDTTDTVNDTVDDTTDTVNDTTDAVTGTLTTDATLDGGYVTASLVDADASLADGTTTTASTTTDSTDGENGTSDGGEPTTTRSAAAGDGSDTSGEQSNPAGVSGLGAGLAAVAAGLLHATAGVSTASVDLAAGYARAQSTNSATSGWSNRLLRSGPLDRLHRFLVAFRYSRHDASDPLEHDGRRAVYEEIEATPGVYLSKIAERTDVPVSTIRHHVRVLTHENLVSSAKIRGRRRYFPVGADAPSVELQSALSDQATARVLEALADVGPAPVGRLADELDRDPSTVSHHLDRLADDGLVERERDGRAVMNSLAPVAERAFGARTDARASPAADD